jgi:hypothetical protein
MLFAIDIADECNNVANSVVKEHEIKQGFKQFAESQGSEC